VAFSGLSESFTAGRHGPVILQTSTVVELGRCKPLNRVAQQQQEARSAAIHPARPFSADSRVESGPEANLDLHQFGDRATGLCFCGD
jgi:hypothetical protein